MVELSPVNRVEFFAITWTISTLGLKCYMQFPALIPGSENKNRLHSHNSVFVINSHYTMDAQITHEFQPWVETIT
jgi:hypothetical protein